MIIALLLGTLGQNPAWPAADADLAPATLARPEHQPDDPDFLGCRTTALYSFTPTCTPSLLDDDRGLGPGVHVDRAWLLTTGRPDVTIALADTGVDWSDPELVARWRLNPGEVPPPTTGTSTTAHDTNGDGAFTVHDFTSATATAPPALDTVVDARLLGRPDRGDANGNGLLDPQDILLIFSDGRDDDSNGRIDDICGWDFLDGDNDPSALLADVDGSRQRARVAVAEANNGIAGVGVCPRCTALALRVAGRGVAPAMHVASAVRYAADRGAAVTLAVIVPTDAGDDEAELVGAVEHAARAASLVVTYASNRGSVGPSPPWDAERVLVTTTLGFDNADPRRATTAWSPDPCSGFGAHALVAAPGRCDEQAPAVVAGIAALVRSASLGLPDRQTAALDPPMSAAELRAVIASSADAPPEQLVSAETSWTPRFGAGRVNARSAIDAVLQRDLPPGAVILAPDPHAIIDPTSGAPFAVEARVSNRRHERASWILDYATGLAPNEDAFVPVASGTLRLGESLPITADIPTEGLFRDATAPPKRPTDRSVTIRLTINARVGGSVARAQARRLVFVHRDLTSLPGFPVDIGASVTAAPRVVDLDGDGAEEIIIATNDGRLFVLEPTADVLAGWPVKLDGEASLAASIVGAPALAPLQVDGPPSIATVTIAGRVFLHDSQGKLHDGWPKLVRSSTATEVTLGPVMADLDGDGVTDVLVTTASGVLDAWSSTGRALAGFPISIGAPVGPPAVGDVDGDGLNDIVVNSRDRAWCYRGDGTLHVGWPVELPSRPVGATPLSPGAALGGAPVAQPSGPVLVSLGAASGLNVIVAPAGGRLVRIDPAGLVTELSATDRLAFGARADARRTGDPVFVSTGHLAVADLDRDGSPDAVHPAATLAFLAGPEPGDADQIEMLLGGWSLASGAFVDGFPTQAHDRIVSGMSIVDLDGDRRPEIIFGDGQFRLHAWSSAGVSPHGWPKLTGGLVEGAPTLGDLDGDGRLEVISVTRHGLVNVFRTNADAAIPIPWEGARHDHAATANLTTPTTARGAKAPNEGCDCRAIDSPHRPRVALWFVALATFVLLGRARPRLRQRERRV